MYSTLLEAIYKLTSDGYQRYATSVHNSIGLPQIVQVAILSQEESIIIRENEVSNPIHSDKCTIAYLLHFFGTSC